MSYFALSGITGCVSPITGETYDVMYNSDKIISYYKKELFQDFKQYYLTVCVFENYSQNFHFIDSSARDNFYNSLPK